MLKEKQLNRLKVQLAVFKQLLPPDALVKVSINPRT